MKALSPHTDKLMLKRANPNEWMLVIKNGEMTKAGIGLRTWTNPFTESVTKFPSRLETIHFEAQQVTKEFQGIEISGFAVWSVNREGDGPFKYYKYVGINSEEANANIKLVAEASVRHVIANSSIEEIMTNRTLIRNQIKKGIMEACEGWGVWCETVEIKTVSICSRQLFEDLQVREERGEARNQPSPTQPNLASSAKPDPTQLNPTQHDQT